MILPVAIPSSIASRVFSGRQSMAVRRSRAGRRRLIVRRHRMRLAGRLAQPAKGELHAPGPDAGLLGARSHGRGSARASAGGRDRRLRLGLDGRGLRLRRSHSARLVRRADRAHQARRGDPADPRPLAGDDRDDRGHPRPPLQRPLPARARNVGPAGGGGLARTALRQAAGAHARIRGDRSQGARPGAPRLRGRYLHAAFARRAGQGPEADDRAGAGAHPYLHRGDRAEEHAARGRDRGRLAAGVLLDGARPPLALAARGGGRALRSLARRLRHRADGAGVDRRRHRPRPGRDASVRGAVRGRDGVAREELLQRAGAPLRLRGRRPGDPGPLSRRQEGGGCGGDPGGADRPGHDLRAARSGQGAARGLPGGKRRDADRVPDGLRCRAAQANHPRPRGDALNRTPGASGRRFLLAAFGDPGHAFPAIALGRELAARGHDVTLETWSRWREHAEREGMRFAAAPEYEVFPTDGRALKPYEAAVRASAETRELIRSVDPEFVVADILTVAATLAAELEDRPWATLVPHVMPMGEPDFPVYAVGAVYPRTRAGARLWRAARPLLMRGEQQGRDELNETRARVGL